jgi:predicted acetyltransferase
MIIKEIHTDDIGNLYDNWNSFKTDIEPITLDKQDVIYQIPSQVNDGFIAGAFLDRELIGCCKLFFRTYEHMYIGGIGKMAVDYKYRHNGIATEILLYMKNIMDRESFDFSMLWASVLKVYEKVGYKAYYRNMMLLPIKKEITLNMLLNLKELPERIGAW